MTTTTLIFVAALLLAGVLLRVHVPLFRWLYIPASVVAGGLGLAVLQWATRWGASTAEAASTAVGASPAMAVTTAEGIELWGSQIAETLGTWPGWLIAVVFAGLLLDRQSGLRRENVRRAFREGLMVWIIVLGQTAIGLLITWLLIQPFYDLPNSVGMLVETGLAGGHGTAAAMGQVFAHPTIDLSAGLALGMLMATAGLIYGVVSGILWINIGVRAGWLASPEAISSEIGFATEPGQVDQTAQSADSSAARVPIGYAVLDRDVLDPLLLQIVWLALAFGIGLGLQTLVGIAAESIDQAWASLPVAVDSLTAEAGTAEVDRRMSVVAVLGSFPLFIYTLFGGWIVRNLLHRCGRGGWIDPLSLQRLSAVAMDILVVAAISSLDLVAVASLLVPFVLLFLGGAIWTAICLLVISRRVLPREHWFELGLINYGMSTGTTATGFVLLRIVDPELRTAAAEDYALAAPLSAPFIGGGMLTIAMPLLVLERVPIAVTALAVTALVAILIWCGVRIGKRA